MKSIRLPSYAVDRAQARQSFDSFTHVATLRIDYRSTTFAGQSFTDELAKCIHEINPVHLEVIGGRERDRELLQRYLNRPFTLIQSI